MMIGDIIMKKLKDKETQLEKKIKFWEDIFK